MITCIGDVHRSFAIFERLVCSLPWAIQAVVQVGDLGLTRADLRRAGSPAILLDRPVYWIDGNWDDFGGLRLREIASPTEILPNLIYVPRGTVLTLDGRRVGFLGGSESLDGERSRSRGVDWWPELEGVTDADVTRLVRAAGEVRGVDLLVAHTPPAPTCELLTGSPAHPSAVRVNQAQAALGGVPVIAGHLHLASRDEERRVTVVEELGTAFL